MNRKDFFKDTKKVVIKVGTSTLTHENGLLNIDKIEKLVRSISHIQNMGEISNYFSRLREIGGAVGRRWGYSRTSF